MLFAVFVFFSISVILICHIIANIVIKHKQALNNNTSFTHDLNFNFFTFFIFISSLFITIIIYHIICY
nr:MAG TPA: hypothetical protein [Caudoviricetes sp.]